MMFLMKFLCVKPMAGAFCQPATLYLRETLPKASLAGSFPQGEHRVVIEWYLFQAKQHPKKQRKNLVL
jgi:hypothetical protein